MLRDPENTLSRVRIPVLAFGDGEFEMRLVGHSLVPRPRVTVETILPSGVVRVTTDSDRGVWQLLDLAQDEFQDLARSRPVGGVPGLRTTDIIVDSETISCCVFGLPLAWGAAFEYRGGVIRLLSHEVPIEGFALTTINRQTLNAPA